VFEGRAPITRAKTEGNLTQDLPEESCALPIDIKMIQWNRLILLSDCVWHKQTK
jgi:hypothetical protein